MHFIVGNKHFSHSKVSANFNKKAQQYQKYSQIQQQASAKLFCLVQKYFITQLSLAQKILDAGSGTSIIGRTWQFSSSSQVFEVDFSFEMLAFWQDRPKNFFPVLADIYHLPFNNHYFDFIISSFALQWLNHNALISLNQVLKHNGLLAVALPNNNSLQNLKNIIKVNQLPNHEWFLQQLTNCGFEIIHHSWQNFCQSFTSLQQALHYFKNIGANTKTTQHNNFSQLLKQKNLWQQQAQLDWQVSFFLAKKIS
jgi:ubiquinone/menaquinone biosynthesis C-methylase UbiE